MPATATVLVALLLLALAGDATAMDIRAAWDNRCEECHGEVDTFSGKYLWAVEGQLQGRHHVDNIRLFLSRHYTPQHELAATYDLLLSEANDPVRFVDECGECHGAAEQFVRQSIIGKNDDMKGVASGQVVRKYLESHQGLQPDDVDFYIRLFLRVKDQIGR